MIRTIIAFLAGAFFLGSCNSKVCHTCVYTQNRAAVEICEEPSWWTTENLKMQQDACINDGGQFH